MAALPASDGADAEPDAGRWQLKRRVQSGRSRRMIVAGAIGLVVAVAVVAFVVPGDDDADTSANASRGTATTIIRRQDLVETEDIDGTLGYSGSRTVVNRLPGTLTRMPKVGSVVKTNRPLYEVDGSAIYLLDGSYPTYRTLRAGLKGDDVRQLERNLRRLGLDRGRDMKVDGTWDAGTTAAVNRWQVRKGMRQDGAIEKGRIVFQRGSRRIREIILPVGSSASGAGGGGGGASPASYEGGGAARTIFASAPSGQAGGGSTGASGGGGASGAPSAPDVAAPLMTTTSTRRIVAVDLETTKQELASKGAAVTVTLPSGGDVAGTIARVGKVAQKKATPQDDDPPATIAIVIKLKKSRGAGLDQAPVDVKLEKRRAKDVLVVPVTALLARAGGEFAVEVRDGARRRVVPVETGLYTDSYVEIDGAGLRAGLKITDAKI